MSTQASREPYPGHPHARGGDATSSRTRRSSRRPTGASATGTSSAACSRTGSSFSAPRSTTTSPTSSSPSFSFWRARIPTRRSCSTSTAPGGVVTSGLAIYDTMQYVRSTVSTTCLGMAASMAAVLLAAGTKGRRTGAAERPRHDPPAAGRRSGSGDRHRDPGPRDPSPEGRHHRHPRERDRQAEGRIHKDIDRDFYMGAVQAKEYGLIDDVLPPRKKGEPEKPSRER